MLTRAFEFHANPYVQSLILPWVDSRPSVEITQYTSTYIYFMNIWSSAIYLLVEPVLMLSLYSLFNNWSVITIFLFLLHWFLAFYSIFLAVATVEIQAYMLKVAVYLNGLVFFLLLTDIV